MLIAITPSKRFGNYLNKMIAVTHRYVGQRFVGTSPRAWRMKDKPPFICPAVKIYTGSFVKDHQDFIIVREIIPA